MAYIMQKTIDIAVLGATGMTGEAIINILGERNFPVGKLYALASKKSVNKTVLFRNKKINVVDADKFNFSTVRLAFFSAGSIASKMYAEKAAATGCIVIDNTSEFRYDSDIPLIVPEVNPNKIADYSNRNIISSPNCSTIQMVVALKPIYDVAGIIKINVATYQSVSGSGKNAITSLVSQTRTLLNSYPGKSKIYPNQIAFNVIPHIDSFLDNGFSKEEMKIVWETQKIFEDTDISINATAVRVPVICGHSEALQVTTKKPLLAQEARFLLSNAPGVKVFDNLNRSIYPTPALDAVGIDAVFVGRVRNEINNEKCLNLWVVSDNIRKGAALNSIQIAEILLKKHIGF